ncbi:ESPR-type extended signal peptide-containing protein [uncultured Mitsuokella sp.]|uniref:ESPR-type extended signal peptide-containing protein n=4 Tax=Mitsuokella TaxID=52225 RepID=UPI00259A41B2|nr:ESPR-type extended signal peptide-containing protein [uncultured Mitsuokella sp.]
MNRIYQVIWSSVKDCYVVVSENAGRHGKKKAVHLAPSTTKRTMLAMSLGAAVLFGSAASASAATGKVIGGGGTESGDTSSATGEDATISGGSKNHAKGTNSSVSGGSDNQAFGEDSSVSGGGQNKATGKGASVAGGFQNQAGGEFSTVSGGSGNKAFGWGSIVIGGTGNVAGKVAVDDNGNYLTDANGNQYPANQGLIGQVSVAIGGVSSSVQGNSSVGIAGGSTSAKAASGLAAGKQATVTMANGVAIGYESTASVIDASRTADTEGRIVSFGHQAGDVYYTVDYQNHTVTENKYDSAAYNRLVNVADGIDDHDVVVMEQLKALASQGMNFSASNKVDGAYKTVKKNLGDTVAVRANDAQDGHTYKTDNLTTEIDDNGIITVKMDTKLTADKVTVGTGDNAITLDGSNGNVTTGSSTLGGTGLTIINGPSVTTSGISGGSKQITEVKSGASSMDDSNNPIYGTDTNVANIGDVKKIAAKTVTVSGDGKNTTVAKTPNADGTVDYKVSLNDSVTLGSDAGKRIALDGTSGTISAGDKVSLNGATGTATIGNAHLGNDGSNTYLTGLTNTTWNGTAVSGRAATEDQLQTVSNTVNAGWKAQIDGTDVKTVTPTNNTLNFVAGDNISLSSGNDIKDIKIATTPDVNFTTVRVGGTKGTGTDTYTGGIYIGSQPGGGANSGTGFYITGLQNTNWNANSIVSGRAATEDQLQQVANAIVNGKETGGGFGLSDNAGTVVKQDLGGAIQLKAADSNLTTTADTTTGKAITIGLSKTLTDMTSATFKDDTTGATTVIDGKGIAITPQNGSTGSQVKLTTDGLSNGGKQITNVQSGLTGTTIKDAAGDVLNHAATIGDLQTVSNGVKTDLTATGLNFKGNNEDTTVHRNLGDTLIIQGTGADGRTYDGGANVRVLADDTTGTLTVQLDRDLNAHTMTLGKASNGTETEEAGTLILNGKNKDNGMSPVSIGVTYRGNQDKEAMKTAMSRITYKGGNGNDHTVATLEDGLQLAGDNGTAIDTTLNKKVTIKGGAKTDKLVDSSDSTKNNNIGVTTNTDNDGNTVLSLQLAKDITGLNTVTAGTVVMGNQSVVSEDKVPGSGNFVTGLDNKAWDGKDFVSGRAATEDQLKKVSDSIRDTVGASTFALTAGGQGEATDATITKKVGESIRIFGDAPKVSGSGDGDGWDRSKANILTKVKKDNKGDEYISVELQDHLEVGTHAGKDTDGKDVAGVDGSMQFKGASAKEVNITGDTGIALSDNGNQTASLHQDNGAGYLDLTGTTAGTKASVSVHTGAKNLVQQDQTRLTYTDQSGKAHDVATMDDGLVVAGDNGQVTRLLNSTLKLSGGETDETKLSSGQNIGVVANKDNDGFDIRLAKDLTGIDSITGLKNTTIGPDFATQGRAATEEQLKLMQSSITSSITQSAQGGGFALTSDEKGDDKIVKQDLGKAIQIKGDTTYKADGSVEKEGNIKTSIDNGAIKVGLNKDVDLGNDGSIKAGGVTIDSNGIDAGGKNITNVKSGIVNGDDSDNTNAANIGDVKTLAGEAAKTEIGKLGSRDFAGDDGEKVSRGLGESMKLSGGADASKLTGGNIGVVKNAAGDGLDIKLSSELTGLTSVTTGNSTLNNDGLTINNSEGKAGTTITGSGIKIAANGDDTHAVEVTNSNVSMGGQQIHDVAPGTADGDAVNVSQLKKSVGALGGAIDKVDRRVDRVGAGAAALAALHPQDFDPDDKWDFAVGYGNYRGANAAAVGAFYRPNEDTTFSVGGTVGGGENMVNAGVSFKFGQGNHVSNSRVAMAKEIKDLRKEVESLRSALVDVAAGKQLDPAKTKLFPDMPKNHWAYKEISELAGNSLLDGYPDGEFKGDRMMTRYEFASIVYRQMMAGRELSDRLVQEFEPELERIRIDVIARHKDGTPSIERVRVNKPADKNSK